MADRFNQMSQWGAYNGANQNNGVANLQSPQLPSVGGNVAGFPNSQTGGPGGPGSGVDHYGNPVAGTPGLDDSSFAAPGAPDVAGAWTKGINTAVGVGQVGLGIYNAIEQSKMNKFMRGYYGDQQALQATDFANAARSSNEALTSREERIQSARGNTVGSAASDASVADKLREFGSSESV